MVQLAFDRESEVKPALRTRIGVKARYGLHALQ